MSKGPQSNTISKSGHSFTGERPAQSFVEKIEHLDKSKLKTSTYTTSNIKNYINDDPSFQKQVNTVLAVGYFIFVCIIDMDQMV